MQQIGYILTNIKLNYVLALWVNLQLKEDKSSLDSNTFVKNFELKMAWYNLEEIKKIFKIPSQVKRNNVFMSKNEL